MTIRNFTPHTINLYAESDCEPGKGGLILKAGAEPIATFPSEGVARATVTEELAYTVQVNGAPVSVYRTEYGAPVGLPEAEHPSKDVCLVVSALTAQAARKAGRSVFDLLLPTRLVRDADGKVVGCTGFSMV